MLRGLVGRHAEETGSRLAARLLNDWDGHRDPFWHVVPKDYARYLPVPMEGGRRTVAAVILLGRRGRPASLRRPRAVA